MSKRVDGRYQSGRTPNWTKVTCRNRETFDAIGIANKGGKFDGLYLARRDGDELLYAGKVENGFSDQLVRDLKERLDPNRARTQPLPRKVKKPKAIWYKPGFDRDSAMRGGTRAPSPNRARPVLRRP